MVKIKPPVQIGAYITLSSPLFHSRSAQRGVATRLFSAVPSSEPAQNNLPPFPRWLRLAASAPVSRRMDLTVAVADVINNKSGGFLSNSNLLSDMVTAMLIEDIKPENIPAFLSSLKKLQDLELTEASVDQLEQCCRIVKEKDGGSLPATVAGVLQLTWKGAQGKLKHEIPADG